MDLVDHLHLKMVFSLKIFESEHECTKWSRIILGGFSQVNGCYKLLIHKKKKKAVISCTEIINGLY